MVKLCCVKGCNRESYPMCGISFHRFPRDEGLKAKWLKALGGVTHKNPVVCSDHFKREDFRMTLNVSRLKDDAVPCLMLPKVELRPYFGVGSSDDDEGSNGEPGPALSECSDDGEMSSHSSEGSEAESPCELDACRVCLATDSRLYAISGSGLEDMLAALTGVEVSAATRFPRHLCAICRARLLNCVAFRDTCQRSTALLHSLLERGPLEMDDIKAINRDLHKLANNLAWTEVFQSEIYNMLIAPPAIKTEYVLGEPEYMEVEYLESEDLMDISHRSEEKLNTNNKKVIKTEQPKNEKVELNNENFDPDFGIDDSYTGNFTDTSEEAFGSQKRVESNKALTKTVEPNKVLTKKIQSNKAPTRRLPSHKVPTRKIKSYDVLPEVDIKDFEQKFNVEYTFVDKEEQMREIEERKRSNTNTMKYCCDLCGQGFTKEQSIAAHMWRHDTRLGAFECSVCHRRFRKSTWLRRHCRRHGDRYRCRTCGLITRDRTNARAHAPAHRGGRWACAHCGAAYARRHSLCNHVRTAHPRHNTACDACGDTFASAMGVAQHKALMHGPIEALQCTVCDVTFSTAEALQRHEQSSVGVSHAALFPCGACGQSCGSDAARAAHVAEKHKADQLHCKECDKTFASSAAFDLHEERKHHGLRAAARPFRRRRPAGSGPLPRSGPPPGSGPFMCEICGRIMGSMVKLTMHRYGHQKRYPCPQCGKRFAQKLSVRIHMRVHTGERPYRCEQCPLAFTQRPHLLRHVKTIHERKGVNVVPTPGRGKRPPTRAERLV